MEHIIEQYGAFAVCVIVVAIICIFIFVLFGDLWSGTAASIKYIMG